MKKKSNRAEPLKLTVLLPVRVTEKERKLIKKAALNAGDYYMTHFMRRAVMEAVAREIK